MVIAMPKKPGRICLRCNGIRHGNVCEHCGAGSGSRRLPSRLRDSPAKRGYDATWRKVRARKLSMTPLCEVCLANHRTTEATEVHHLQPFHGLHDPLRLSITNLKSICKSCHETETGRGGTPGKLR